MNPVRIPLSPPVFSLTNPMLTFLLRCSGDSSSDVFGGRQGTAGDRREGLGAKASARLLRMAMLSCRSLSSVPSEGTVISVPKLWVAGIIFAGGCTTGSERQAMERAAVTREAANEISRICGLSEPERTAELKRVEVESGVVISCAEPKEP
jgi:hypothetical protein